MRKELEIIERIENYLLDKLNSADKIAFENELISDTSLQSNVNVQQNLMAGIKRMGLRKKAIKAKRKYKTRKILKYASITMAIILSISAYVLLSNNEGGLKSWFSSASEHTNYCDCEVNNELEKEIAFHDSVSITEDLVYTEIAVSNSDCIDTCQVISTDHSYESIITSGHGEHSSQDHSAQLHDVDEVEVGDNSDRYQIELEEESTMEVVNMNNVEAENQSASDLQVSPSFPGGHAAMTKWVENKLDLSEIQGAARINGSVYINFTISEKGQIQNPVVQKGLSTEIDQIMLDLIKAMPDWSPGQYAGENVPVNLTIPFQVKNFGDTE